jgi:WD40 repeat protein
MAAGGGLVIAATDDLRVHAWSVDAADATPHGDGVVVPARVRALAVAADGRAVALAGESFVHVYAIVDGRIAAAVSPLVLDGPTGVVDGVVFSRDGALIITASSDGLARVWDAANGKQLGARVVHGAATALALAADDATLWIASDDGDVTAFDVHVATGPVDAFAAAHAPWRLGDDDVVVRRFGDAQPVEAR